MLHRNDVHLDFKNEEYLWERVPYRERSKEVLALEDDLEQVLIFMVKAFTLIDLNFLLKYMKQAIPNIRCLLKRTISRKIKTI